VLEAYLGPEWLPAEPVPGTVVEAATVETPTALTGNGS
jgi:hypothetical protein